MRRTGKSSLVNLRFSLSAFDQLKLPDYDNSGHGLAVDFSGHIRETEDPMTIAFPSPAATSPTVPDISGMAELTHLGVIRATGEDAASFLQSQLTQDVLSLGLSEARLAAFCNAKGRMQASFIVFKRSEQEILLLCSRDILPATLKRLSMFVMRAKARLMDASDEFRLLGLVGIATELIAACARSAWAKTDIGRSNVIFLPPGAGQARVLWCAPLAEPLPELPLIELNTWHWLAVQSGIAMISQPIFEAFVPQMLNYESVGGVNFKKGCYPGQEIVARSQYLGKLKRRATLATIADATAAAGDEVYAAVDPGQPCGMVVNAAPNGLGGTDVLVEMKLAALEAGDIRLGSDTGAPLALLDMPYPLDALEV